MSKMELTSDDKRELSMAANMRANWIETGSVAISAMDAIGQRRADLARPLSLDQQRLWQRLREIAGELFKEALSSSGKAAQR